MSEVEICGVCDNRGCPDCRPEQRDETVTILVCGATATGKSAVALRVLLDLVDRNIDASWAGMNAELAGQEARQLHEQLERLVGDKRLKVVIKEVNLRRGRTPADAVMLMTTPQDRPATHVEIVKGRHARDLGATRCEFTTPLHGFPDMPAVPASDPDEDDPLSQHVEHRFGDVN